MMTNIDHGAWKLYVPSVHPPYAPANALFCQRTSDGMDWYEFIYYNSGAPRESDAAKNIFAPGSIKITVEKNIVNTATRDESLLFPQGMTVVEVTGDSTSDPHAKYGGKVYDPVTKTFSDPIPTREQEAVNHLAGGLTADFPTEAPGIGTYSVVSPSNLNVNSIATYLAVNDVFPNATTTFDIF